MAGELIYSGLRVRPQQYNTTDNLTVKDIYTHPSLANSPTNLDNTMTWLAGNQMKSGHLQMMTIGAALNNISSDSVSEIEVNNTQYEWHIMGEIERNDACAKTDYVDGVDEPGFGGNSFYMWFPSNWLKEGWVIESPREYQVMVRSYDQVQEDLWRYEVEPVNISPTESIPVSELESGTLWTDLFAPVSEIDSKAPGFGRRVLPGKATNAITNIRHSMKWTGNVVNRETNLLIDVPGVTGEVNYFIAYDMWRFEKEWLMQKETLCMYGEYNVLTDGKTSLRDPESGEYIKIGAGLIQQIPNRDQYTELSYNKLKQLMYGVYYGREETHAMKITLMTGLGGMDEFDRAMKGYLVTQGWSQERNRVIQEMGKDENGLETYGINGFFTKLYLIGGFTVSVVYHPIFDYGKRARKSPLHPVSGLPLESYKMIFLDTNNYEGSPNLQYVYEKGNRMRQKYMPGMNDGPKSLAFKNFGDLTVSERNSSSVHRAGSCGIVLRRPLLSLYVECSIS